MVKDGNTTTYTYNSNNQLATETAGGTTKTYSYDLNGNLVAKSGGGIVTYTWDWRNHLLSVSSAQSVVYEYDGDGKRLSKTTSGVKTKYINDDVFGLTQVLMETNEANVVQATYSYGNDLISMNRADVNSYYLYDGLGSTRQLTDSSQTVVASYTYDGYGNLIASSSSVANSYCFTGEQQFSETDNLVFLRARYYKPIYGRFISRDPIGYRGGISLYAYCRNNPVNRIDPTGEFAWALPVIRIGIGIGSGIVGGTHCYYCYKCISTAADYSRDARARMSPEAYECWSKSAKPGSECAPSCEGCLEWGIPTMWGAWPIHYKTY